MLIDPESGIITTNLNNTIDIEVKGSGLDSSCINNSFSDTSSVSKSTNIESLEQDIMLEYDILVDHYGSYIFKDQGEESRVISI